MNKLALLSLPVLLAACVTPGTAAQTVPEGPARIGETVRVGGPMIRPIAVIDDSRCPTAVTCVWEGTLKLRVEVTTGRGKRVMELTLGEPVKVGDGMLTLTQVTPNIGEGPYRFTFKFADGI